MENIIIELIEKFGYLAVALLIAIENIFPPIPSEIILTFSGFATTISSMTILGAIISSVIGSMVGAFALYYIGRILNKERLKKIVNGKIGKLLRLKEKDIDKADSWFDNKGNKTVFFCRFIPIVRSLISIPAGMSEMPVFKFFIYTFFGSVIWNSVLIVLGYIVGDKWQVIVEVMDKYSYATLAVLIVMFIIVVVMYFKKRKKVK